MKISFYTNIIKNEPMLWISLFSLFISFFMSTHFFINNDGIYYVEGAEALLNHETHAALVWPFYPVLIAGLSYITSLSFVHSALVWQALFQVLLIVSFIQITRLLGANKTIQTLAGIILLISPELVDYRNVIIRDFGYWAFLFASFYYFIRYCQKPTWLNGMMWFATLSIAFLFRIEAIVVMALIPLLGLLATQHSWKKRMLNAARLYGLEFIAATLLVSLLFISGKGLLLLGRLAELPAWWTALTVEFSINWADLIEHEAVFLWQVHSDSIEIFLVGGFFFYFMYEIIKVMNPFLLGVSVYGQWKHCLGKFAGTLEQRLVLGFLAINLFIPAVFLATRWFIRGRFLMPAVLLLLLWVPFTLYALYQQWHHHPFVKRHYRALQLILCAIVLFLFIDGVTKFNSPAALVKESAQWIEMHTPENATLYSNNRPLSYYSNRSDPFFRDDYIAPAFEDVLEGNEWKKYDYLALFIERKNKKSEKLIEKTIPYEPIERFQNRRGYQVWIYKVKN